MSIRFDILGVWLLPLGCQGLLEGVRAAEHLTPAGERLGLLFVTLAVMGLWAFCVHCVERRAKQSAAKFVFDSSFRASLDGKTYLVIPATEEQRLELVAQNRSIAKLRKTMKPQP